MLASSQRELEAKFSVTSFEVAQNFAVAGSIVPGYTLSEATHASQDDSYYDTPVLGLLRRGYVLRVREDGGQVLVGIKGLQAERGAGWQDRYEDEHVITPSGDPPFVSEWPAATRDFVADLIGRAPSFQPLAALHQERAKRLLTPIEPKDGGGSPPAPAIELSIDAVSVKLDSIVSEGGSTRDFHTCFHMIEAELLPAGTPKHLRQVVRALKAYPGVLHTDANKLRVALQHLAATSPGAPSGSTGIQPDMHMAEACRLIWRTQLAHIVFAEHGVRADAHPEYVHEMRVAIRRARTAQKLLGDYFRPRALRSHFRAMRRLGQLAGAVRDLDVALLNLQTYRKRTEKAHRQGLKELQKELLAQRGTALTALIDYLDGDRHAEFVADFLHFTRTPGEGTRRSLARATPTEPVKVCHVLPALLQDRFARVRAFAPLFEDSASASAQHLHALRIECKYLRYAIEFGRHLLGPEGEEMIELLKRLQDQLGGINDAAVESRRLLAWQAAGMDNAALHMRLEDLRQTSQSLSSEIPATFVNFVSYDNRCRLGQAIARI